MAGFIPICVQLLTMIDTSARSSAGAPALDNPGTPDWDLPGVQLATLVWMGLSSPFSVPQQALGSVLRGGRRCCQTVPWAVVTLDLWADGRWGGPGAAGSLARRAGLPKWPVLWQEGSKQAL